MAFHRQTIRNFSKKSLLGEFFLKSVLGCILRNRGRIDAAETCITVVLGALNEVLELFRRQISEGICSDIFTDIRNIVLTSDEIITGIDVGTVIARVLERR